MYLEKVPVTSSKNCVKKLVSCWHLRIRIYWSEAWIRGSGSRSTPKCHGSGTLQETNEFLLITYPTIPDHRRTNMEPEKGLAKQTTET
jgi:hypothetical protein